MEPAGLVADAVVERLEGICRGHGLVGLAARLEALGELSRKDLGAVEEGLGGVRCEASVVGDSARHLLSLGGKRLRPLCVALASRLGSGFGPAARELAVAVELVHSATLLHDDVVDLGEVRRGAPTARQIWGNAASVFAGDWLLVEALERVRAAGVPGALERLLLVIRQMIAAEAVQLEARGRLSPDPRQYLAIVEGKTAALFRWALWAGGRAGGIDESGCAALEAFGLHLGIAFQAVDDLLDFAGDAAATGKSLFVDLREGKMTWPLIVAVDAEPGLAATLEATLREDALPSLRTEILAALQRTSAIAATREFAAREAALAIDCLRTLPSGEARRALETVAAATVERDR